MKNRGEELAPFTRQAPFTTQDHYCQSSILVLRVKPQLQSQAYSKLKDENYMGCFSPFFELALFKMAPFYFTSPFAETKFAETKFAETKFAETSLLKPVC